jgi:hypothetical protein
MPGENGAQQAHRTPRAKHKHSKSAVAPVSDSEGLVAGAQAGSGHKKGNRRNQHLQAHNAPQSVPAWQKSEAAQVEGFFDAHGNFVSHLQGQPAAGGGQVPSPGMFYMSDGVHAQGASHSKKKARQGKNGRHLNGANTPPHANSDNEQFLSPAMLQTMTPARAAAYAGPTFHASPAANSLPIPKFFSKSVPNDGANVGLQARMEQEPQKSDSSDKTDSPPTIEAIPAIPVPERSNESPLDFLFKADKEQKAKRQSTDITLTPPAKQNGNISSEPPRANPWQSIYGTGSRNHQRHPSTGSGKEMFMMELDGREASPRPKHISPPPALPRLLDRSLSDQTSVPQPSPQTNFHHHPPPPNVYQTNSHNASVPPLPASVSDPRPTMDQTYSPFNRGVPYPTPRSAETTPTPQQNGLYTPSQNALHYGNRNLSPLFKAAKQDSTRPPSNLRQEVHHAPPQAGFAELPDSSPSRPVNPHRRASTQAEKAALAYLQTHVSNAPAMPSIPLPRTSPLGPSELDGSAAVPARTGVTPPGVNAFNAKSIEDDLKRMLKLTGGIK